MNVLVVDPHACDTLIEQRRLCGGDRYDEMWDGVYVVNPLASNEHQRMVMRLSFVMHGTVVASGGGTVLPGANVASSETNRERDYHCPDVDVVLAGGRARDIGPALVGGPDFLIEIRSPGETAAKKLPFYERIGVRELLVVDRDSKEAELFRLTAGRLTSVGTSSNDSQVLASGVLPLSFARASGGERPQLIVRRTEEPATSWTV